MYRYIYIYIYIYRSIDVVGRVFAIRPGFKLMPSHTKDSKMVLDASWLNTKHYKLRF